MKEIIIVKSYCAEYYLFSDKETSSYKYVYIGCNLGSFQQTLGVKMIF